MAIVKSNRNSSIFPSVFSDFFDNDRFFNNQWFNNEQSVPAVNIKENESSFNVEFAAPGFKKTDFKINVEHNVLTISAEKKDEKNEENDRYTRKEFAYSSFSRSFTLPQSVDSEKIDAKYNDGILNLSIPKKTEDKNKTKREITIG